MGEEKKKERTSNEVTEELKTIRDDIVRIENEKERIQNDINEAVANDQFDVAGQLAPRKKELIAEMEDKQSQLKRLEQELQECIERESQQQSAEELVDVDNATTTTTAATTTPNDDA